MKRSAIRAGPTDAAGRLPDGLVLVDKPSGITSFDVIRRLHRLVAGRKIGHAGTLDPFATGLLPLCVGEATKLASFVVAGEKEYVARLKLGERTDTGDLDGVIIQRAPVPILGGTPALDEVLQRLVGVHRQIPPMHSAVKVDGEPLYARARRGESIERPAREVEVRALVALDVTPGEIVVRVECSKGTYIRVLAEAIAEALGTVGHLRELRRVRVGDMRIESAASIESILAAAPTLPSQAATWFIALDDSLPHALAIDLAPSAACRVLHGQVVPELDRDWPAQAPRSAIVRIRCAGKLLAIACREPSGKSTKLLRVLVRSDTNLQDPLLGS